jgi:hypothetical protein
MDLIRAQGMFGLPRNAAFNASVLMALLGGTCACSDLKNCPAGKPDITVETGRTNLDARTYQSAPFNGPRDAFPAMTTMHFMHRLGFTPEFMESFVSFLAENSSASENAGNQAEWVCVDDDEFVVRNDTCQDFYIVVSAYGSGTEHAPCKCSDRRKNGSCPE